MTLKADPDPDLSEDEAEKLLSFNIQQAQHQEYIRKPEFCDKNSIYVKEPELSQEPMTELSQEPMTELSQEPMMRELSQEPMMRELSREPMTVDSHTERDEQERAVTPVGEQVAGVKRTNLHFSRKCYLFYFHLNLSI